MNLFFTRSRVAKKVKFISQLFSPTVFDLLLSMQGVSSPYELLHIISRAAYMTLTYDDLPILLVEGAQV